MLVPLPRGLRLGHYQMWQQPLLHFVCSNFWSHLASFHGSHSGSQSSLVYSVKAKVTGVYQSALLGTGWPMYKDSSGQSVSSFQAFSTQTHRLTYCKKSNSYHSIQTTFFLLPNNTI